MRRARNLLSVMLATLLVTAGGYTLGLYGLPELRDGGALNVPTDALNLGSVWAQENFTWSVPVTNLTKGPVAVEGIGTSCGCTSVQPDRFLLRRGETIVLRTLIDLEDILGPKSDVWEKEFSIRLTLHSAGGSQQEWDLKGRVRRPYKMINSPEFGESLIAGEVHEPRSFLIACNRELSELELKEQEFHFGTVQLTRSPDTKNRYMVKLCPRRSMAVGIHDISIGMAATDSKARRCAVSPVRLRLTVFPDIQVVPATQPLGIVTCNQPRAYSFLLRSRTGKAFRILAQPISAEKPVSARILGASASKSAPVHSVDVEIVPRQYGAHSAKVLLMIEYEGGGPTVAVPLFVAYVGDEATGHVPDEPSRH